MANFDNLGEKECSGAVKLDGSDALVVSIDSCEQMVASPGLHNYHPHFKPSVK